MKIACIGSNLESEHCLNVFIKRGFKIDYLITRPNGNAGSVTDYVNLHSFCETNGIEVYSTTNVNESSTVTYFKELEIDVLLTLGWSQLFKTEFRSCFKIVIGSHPTLLPKGRGRAPIPWTILNDIKTTGVSFFIIDEGVDTGKVILQKQIALGSRSNATYLYRRVSEELSEGFSEIIESLLQNNTLNFPDLKLNETGNYHTAKRVMSDGLIDFSLSSLDVDRLVRALSHPYPGAYSYFNDNRIFFFCSEPIESENYFGAVGQILEINNSSLRISCGIGSIWLSEIRDSLGLEVSMSKFKLHDKFGYSVQDEIYRLRVELNKLKSDK